MTFSGGMGAKVLQLDALLRDLRSTGTLLDQLLGWVNLPLALVDLVALSFIALLSRWSLASSFRAE